VHQAVESIRSMKVPALNAQRTADIVEAQPDIPGADRREISGGPLMPGKRRPCWSFESAFIEIEDGFDGLVHVSDVSWTERIKNPHEVFKKGEDVTAKVLKIDPEEPPRLPGHQAGQRHLGRLVQATQGWANRESKVSAHRHVRRLRRIGEEHRALCHNTEIEEAQSDDGPSSFRPTLVL